MATAIAIGGVFFKCGDKKGLGAWYDPDGALEQVERGGAEVVGEIEEYGFGRFGWFIDPAGTKIELWQPAAAEPEGA